MVNQTSIVAAPATFFPRVCRCTGSFTVEVDCVVGDPTYREITFCVKCGLAVTLEGAIFQARVAVNPQFECDSHVMDYVNSRLENSLQDEADALDAEISTSSNFPNLELLRQLRAADGDCVECGEPADATDELCRECVEQMERENAENYDPAEDYGVA